MRPKEVMNTAMCLAALGGATCRADDPAWFRGLGHFPGAPVTAYTSAVGVSGDGTMVAGTGDAGQGLNQPFRWTLAQGIVPLGTLPGDDSAAARAISADGTTIVGSSAHTGSTRAFAWTAAGGMVDLGALVASGNPSAVGMGLSGDGSVIVGQAASAQGPQAFRWQSGPGMIGMGALPGAQFNSMATGASADGSVIAGWSGAVGSQMAFRWTAATGMTAIPLAPTGRGALALGVSADGSVIVGEMFRTTAGIEAFRWTAAAGMTALGAFSTGGGTTYSYAQAVSADGNRVVGFSTTVNGQEALVWTPQGGLTNLQDQLTTAGVDTTGWLLSYAYAVSADGRTIVGQGLHLGQTEAWAAHLPRPCYANCDNSTTAPRLNVLDFACFLNKFAAGDPQANCDGSTTPPVLNVLDFSCFINAFAAGCS